MKDYEFTYKGGVGALEKAVRLFVRKLEQDGYEVDLDVFRSGQGGSWDRSYVELNLSKTIGSEEYWQNIRVMANGYYSSGGKITVQELKKKISADTKAWEKKARSQSESKIDRLARLAGSAST